MVTSDLLLGNVGIAAVLIKTIISFVRNYLPVSAYYVPMVALFLGVVSSYVIGARLFDLPHMGTFALYVEHALAGMLIGATAMGVHETTKKVCGK